MGELYTSSFFRSFQSLCLSALLAIVLQVVLYAAGASIHGRVLDESQSGIANAEISLINMEGVSIASTRTGRMGEYRLEDVPAGSYQVTATHAGFQAAAEMVTTGPGGEFRVNVILRPETVRETITITESIGYQVPVSPTATKMPVPLKEIPQSIQVVGRELLNEQAALSMQDALRNVAGVSVHLGEGRRDQVYIRGFSALNDNYIDGVRDDATYYRDLSNVEQIDVVKGPASVLFGRGSSGGLVNRVTKKPNVERPLGEVAVLFGSYGVKRTQADVGMPFYDGKLAFRLNGAYEDSGSYRDRYYLDRWAVSPSLAWKPSGRTQFLGQFEFLNDDRLPDRGIPSLNGRPAPVRIGEYYGYPQDDFMRNRVASQALRLEHQTLSNWTVRNVFRHSGYANAFSNTQATGIRQTGGELFALRQQYNVSGNQQNYFNQTETVGTVQWWGMTHTILAGMELGSQTSGNIRFQGTAAPVALFHPILTRPDYATNPSRDNVFTGRVFGLYVQDQIRVAPRWIVSAGARRDRYSQALNDRSPTNPNLARLDYAWSPRIGVVYQATMNTSLYTSFSRSFQPSGEGLSLAANNADLKPEYSQNYEVGAKNDLFRGRLTLNLAVFRLNRNNMKTTDPVDPNRLVLVGRQRTDGAEVSLAGTLTRRWTVYGGYAWLSTRILRSNSVSSGVPIEGNRAGHIPLNSANLWSTYTFENGFGFGAGWVNNGARYTSNDNLVVLPGYNRFDATVFWRHGRYDVGINVRNLLNTQYYETAHANFQIYPGAPVNGLVTMRYRW